MPVKLPFRRRQSTLARLRSRMDSLLSSWDDEEDADDEPPLGTLHWMTAVLYAAAGAETAFGERRGDYRDPDALRWAPLAVAPVASAAHAARALWPNRMTRNASLLVNGLALGVGVAGLASSVYSALSEANDDADWTEHVPSLAPLAFGAIGVLGFMLENEEEEIERRQSRLERRAHIVERLVPSRKARLDRIVVHV